MRAVVFLIAVIAAVFGVVYNRSRAAEGAEAAGPEVPLEALPLVQDPSAIPYKLGSFELDGRAFVGAVLDEQLVLDLTAANGALPTRAAQVAPPADMKDLIARWEDGLRARTAEIVAYAADAPTGPRPAWMHELAALRVRPPVMYPLTLLSVAVNYREHDIEMASVREGAPTGPTGGEALPNTTSATGIWDRAADDPRWNPYMFLKAPASIVAHMDPIVIPPGRDRIEWECEMTVVIGRPSTRVPVGSAFDHVFGYTMMNDVSDRGGRGDQRYNGSDWLVTKSHDSFAPMGPFITPKEFVADPHALRLTYSLNGDVLQDGTTAQMIHRVDELVSYASNILTLRPGDAIATGTLPGSGSARTPPVFFQPGDQSVCHYDGLGTLVNPVQGAEG